MPDTGLLALRATAIYTGQLIFECLFGVLVALSNLTIILVFFFGWKRLFRVSHFKNIWKRTMRTDRFLRHLGKSYRVYLAERIRRIGVCRSLLRLAKRRLYESGRLEWAAIMLRYKSFHAYTALNIFSLLDISLGHTSISSSMFPSLQITVHYSDYYCRYF